MSFVRLLALGKSMVGLGDKASGYKLSRKRLLPKFPASKNPFRLTTRPELPVDAEPELRFSSFTPEPEPQAVRSAGLVVKDATVATAAARRNPAGKIWARWFGQRNTQAETAQQAELSLKTVKVVRNDLSHYDTESDERKVPMMLPKRAGATAPAARPADVAAQLNVVENARS